MGTSPAASPLTRLREHLPEVMLHERRRLRRRIDGAHKIRDPRTLEAVAAEIAADVEAATQRVQRRRDSVPALEYPAELPVSQRRDDLLAAIRDHQVVIVAGETGSGKTTQIPKMCLELGRGVHGIIGHTQPRRVAARSVAERLAEELGTELGGVVGYQVRFTDRAGEDTLVKLMTDGILLAEIQRDPQLRRYDTLIIDEAHERSLNVDFLLGYLNRLLPRRPDLKVVITSATIDPERFSRHFDGAPVVQVSGRTYPVEVRYRPLLDPDGEHDRDQTQAICEAVDELAAEGPGDILVFLSGEREIRDAADALRQQELRNTEIVPLYARLSAAEQHRVFEPHTGRRIVLATNVAETSLTVPGIRYVIDPGTARISRYSHRTKVQRLPIESISQASANQRKGRCGRLSDGVCIRLYSEQDFLSRPEFTDPEVLRTSLASVILQMAALGLGDIASFPFVQPPDRRQVTDGLNLLYELGAVENSGKQPEPRLTATGRRLAQLPIDPRLARMLLEAESNGCLREVLVIASGLSIQDTRERPTEHQQAADEKHARFADKESDFVAYHNLWQYLRERQRELSSSQFRRMCKAEFLNYLRVREWQDLHSQLREIVTSLGMSLNDNPAGPAQIHRSLLAGLLSHVGLKDPDPKSPAPGRAGNEYVGARNARFAIFPGSALFKKPPRWVMAAELVETSRLWARVAARIEPDWVENLAQHLVKRSYSEPHWERRQGAVMAYEKVTLYGIPLAAGRKVHYGRIDPELCRELFIRHALVEGDWETRHEFFLDNRALIEEVEELEERARRRDILVADETLFDFYDQRVPADVVSARHFDAWWKKQRRTEPHLLHFDKSLLINDSSQAVSDAEFPDAWRQGGHQLPLSYQYEPGADADGVTVEIPLAILNQISDNGFDWHVPGMRAELVTALIKSLPKQLRRNFVPVPDYVRAVLSRLDAAGDTGESLLTCLERELHRMTGVAVPREAWQLANLPRHLTMTYRVVDGEGAALAEDSDLTALKERMAPKLRAEISVAGHDIERSGVREWDFGTLPRTFEQHHDGHAVKAYPAVVDEGGTVGVRLFASQEEQQRAQWQGIRRLLMLSAPSPVKQIQRGLSNDTALLFRNAPHGDIASLLDDCVTCAVDKLIAEHGGTVWDAEGFAALERKVRSGLLAATGDIVSTVEHVLRAAQQADLALGDRSVPDGARADIRRQLTGLVYPGFVAATGYQRLPDVVRYLRAIEYRLRRLPDNPQRDREWMAQINEVEDRYRDLVRRDGSPSAALLRVGWMIEELRVSRFAQQLGTAHSISEKRIHRAMDELA